MRFLIFLLWIAFKSLYLWYSEQLSIILCSLSSSCELLSKVCIFDILSNSQSSIVCQLLLWIAFKSLYLWYSEQHYAFGLAVCQVVNCFQKFVSLIFWATVRIQGAVQVCCELLSKVCIFDILSNFDSLRLLLHCVVNCFQKFVSLIFWATYCFYISYISMLWIAFKSLYLWYSEQLHCCGGRGAFGCELLSKVCIFDILSNKFS